MNCLQRKRVALQRREFLDMTCGAPGIHPHSAPKWNLGLKDIWKRVRIIQILLQAKSCNEPTKYSLVFLSHSLFQLLLLALQWPIEIQANRIQRQRLGRTFSQTKEGNSVHDNYLHLASTAEKQKRKRKARTGVACCCQILPEYFHFQRSEVRSRRLWKKTNVKQIQPFSAGNSVVVG